MQLCSLPYQEYMEGREIANRLCAQRKETPPRSSKQMDISSRFEATTVLWKVISCLKNPGHAIQLPHESPQVMELLLQCLYLLSKLREAALWVADGWSWYLGLSSLPGAGLHARGQAKVQGQQDLQ